jgi:hypothetical protein
MEETDWDKSRCLSATGTRLTAVELANDQAARRLLSSPEGAGVLSQATAVTSTPYDAIGYPLFLTACYAVFGYEEAPPLVPVQIIQNLINALTAVLLFSIVQLLLDRPPLSLLVSTIYLLHPGITRTASSLTSDTLYSFANALILLCIVLFFKNAPSSRASALAMGITLGIGGVMEPHAAPYLLLFIGVAGLQCFLTRQRIQPYLLVLLGCTLVFSPWLVAFWLIQDNIPVWLGFISLFF